MRGHDWLSISAPMSSIFKLVTDEILRGALSEAKALGTVARDGGLWGLEVLLLHMQFFD